MKKNLFLLIFINILWGFIPWPTATLFETYSMFLVIFCRFIMMGLFLFLSVIILLLIDNQHHKKDDYAIKPRNLLKYLGEKNLAFRNLPQWLYLLIVAIVGMNGNVILFFWGLKTVGAIITSIGFIIALIVTTAVNWGMGKEDMSNFKIIYLLTLFVAMIIIGLVGQSTEITGSTGSLFNFDILSWDAVAITGSYGLVLAFFLISSSTDKMSGFEFNIIRNNKKYKLIRTLFKVAILSLFSGISLVPLLLIVVKLPLDPEIIGEITLFYDQIGMWWQVSLTWNGLILIFGCTVIPYLIYYALAASWPKNSSFDLWAGVIQIFEPIINIIIGISVLDEKFSISWLIIVIFLMLMAIITRFLSETEAQVNAILIIKVHPHYFEEAMKKAFELRGVRKINSLMGEYDLFCDLNLSSQKALLDFIEKQIPKIPGIRAYQILNIMGVEWEQEHIDSEKETKK